MRALSELIVRMVNVHRTRRSPGERHYTHVRSPCDAGSGRLLDTRPTPCLPSITRGTPLGACSRYERASPFAPGWLKGAIHMEQHPFDETAEGRRRALSRRDLLAATGGVVLAGSVLGNAGTSLAAG